jgi:hypothetical protein
METSQRFCQSNRYPIYSRFQYHRIQLLLGSTLLRNIAHFSVEIDDQIFDRDMIFNTGYGTCINSVAIVEDTSLFLCMAY